MSLITQTYKPVSLVGQVYARAYGTATPLAEIGNVLELQLTHEENVRRQDDFTRLGGGTHARVSRIGAVNITMTLADINLVNLARGIYGTASESDADPVTDEQHIAYPGGLIRLSGLAPSSVSMKTGAPASAVADATPVAAAGNYEVRPEGIYILPGSTIAAANPVWITYTPEVTGTVEALTSAAPELELSFGGLNEAQSGKPVVVDVWRLSQGIAQTLALMGGEFMSLPITGEVLKDPTKTGAGISPFYRTRFT